MRTALALLVIVTSSIAAHADDWTGKTVRPKENGLKLGRKLGGGLVRDGAALDKAKTYTVKSDDGTLLELDGGFVFRSDVEVAADARPFPKPLKDGETVKTDGWFGKSVLPKRDHSEIRMGAWNDGKQETWTPHELGDCIVREDRDGFLRVFDGRREGWVHKADMVTAEDAPTYFDKAIKANEKDSYAWHMRAAGWFNKGEYDNAIKDYTEAIRLRPNNFGSYNGRGMAWAGKKEYDKAIADYTEAIRLNPTEPVIYRTRGDQFFYMRAFNKAIADHNEAIRLDPKHAPAFNSRGATWYRKQEYHKAVADYDTALELDPKNAAAHSNRAEAYAKLKQYDEAVAGFEKSSELRPRSSIYRDFAKFRASCPDAKYRYGKKAVELAKKAIEKAGKDADWQYADALAMAYAEAGDFELAVSEQRKAIDMLKAEKFAHKDDIKAAESRLDLYRAKKPYRDEE